LAREKKSTTTEFETLKKKSKTFKTDMSRKVEGQPVFPFLKERYKSCTRERQDFNMSWSQQGMTKTESVTSIKTS